MDDGTAPAPRVTPSPRVVQPREGPSPGQPNAPLRRVAGRVSFEGKPLPAARVRIEPIGLPLQAPRELQSDAAGLFDFGLQPPLPFMVSASAPGRTGASRAVDLRDPLAHPEFLALELTGCDARLTGRILDPEGGVIRGARVRAKNALGVVTDEQGAYELCLPRGLNQVAVEADGYASLRASVPTFSLTPYDLVLSPEAFVVGRVVLQGTQHEVAEARVTLIPAERGQVQPLPVSTLTNRAGVFRIGVAPGDHFASAWADGLHTLDLVSVTATVSTETEPLTLELTPLSRVRGRVLSAGQLVAGAHVRIRSAMGNFSEGVSQGDGTFVIDLVTPGDVTISAHPWAVTAPERFRVEKAEEFVEVEVRRLGSVRGTVTREGRAIARAEVRLSSRDGQRLDTTESDDEGRYELQGVSAGTWLLGAGGERLGAFKESHHFSISDGEDKRIDLELDQSASIAGTVRDEGGKPVAGVFVQFVMKKSGDRGETLTDGEGHFLCTTMSGGGDYLAAVFPSPAVRTSFHPGRGTAYPTVTLETPTSRVEGVELIIKYQQLEISGRVVDVGGEPVPDARLRAVNVQEGRSPEFASWAPGPRALSDTRGVFALRGLTEGKWALEAIAPDGAQSIVPMVAAGTKDVVITLKPRGGIDGILVGYRERPVVYAQPYGSSGQLVRGAVRGDRFSIQVPGGSYVVAAMSASEGDAQRVEVAEGARATVTMTSRARAAVTGRVVEYRTHTPVPGVQCTAIASAGADARTVNVHAGTATTDAQGEFVIDPSASGELQVICFSSAGEVSMGSARTSVSAGGRASVTIEVVRRADGEQGDPGFTLELRGSQPFVLGVRAGSVADDAGLRIGDIIVGVDGTSTAALTPWGVALIIQNHPPGSSLSLSVDRAGAMKSLSFVIE